MDLQSDFDGDELLLRANTKVVTIGPEAIAKALLEVAGCQGSRGDESQLLFDSILADVLGVRGAVEFMLAEKAHCPNCRATLGEKCLVEPG